MSARARSSLINPVGGGQRRSSCRGCTHIRDALHPVGKKGRRGGPLAPPPLLLAPYLSTSSPLQRASTAPWSAAHGCKDLLLTPTRCSGGGRARRYRWRRRTPPAAAASNRGNRLRFEPYERRSRMMRRKSETTPAARTSPKRHHHRFGELRRARDQGEGQGKEAAGGGEYAAAAGEEAGPAQEDACGMEQKMVDRSSELVPSLTPVKKSPAILQFCAIHEATWGLSRDGHHRLWDDDGDDLVAADDEHGDSVWNLNRYKFEQNFEM
ncbi:hypothetical protein EJB05_49024, partial [Eragrostis curvula]